MVRKTITTFSADVQPAEPQADILKVGYRAAFHRGHDPRAVEGLGNGDHDLRCDGRRKPNTLQKLQVVRFGRTVLQKYSPRSRERRR